MKSHLVKELGPEGVKLVVGNTAIGIYSHEKPRVYIDVSRLPELTSLSERDDGVHLGAAAVIQDLIDFAASVIARRPAEQTIGLRDLPRTPHREDQVRDIAKAAALCTARGHGNIIETGRVLLGRIDELGAKLTLDVRKCKDQVMLGLAEGACQVGPIHYPSSHAGEVQT